MKLFKKKILWLGIGLIGGKNSLGAVDLDEKGFSKKMAPGVQFSIFNDNLVGVDLASPTPSIWTNLPLLEEIIAGKYTRLLCGQSKGEQQKIWKEEIQLAMFLKEKLIQFLQGNKEDWEKTIINNEDIYVFKKSLVIDEVALTLHINNDNNLYFFIKDKAYNDKKYKTVAKNKILVDGRLYNPPSYIQDIYKDKKNTGVSVMQELEEIFNALGGNLADVREDNSLFSNYIETTPFRTISIEICFQQEQEILHLQNNYIAPLINRLEVFINNFLRPSTPSSSRDTLIDLEIDKILKTFSLKEGTKEMQKINNKIYNLENEYKNLDKNTSVITPPLGTANNKNFMTIKKKQAQQTENLNNISKNLAALPSYFPLEDLPISPPTTNGDSLHISPVSTIEGITPSSKALYSCVPIISLWVFFVKGFKFIGV